MYAKEIKRLYKFRVSQQTTGSTASKQSLDEPAIYEFRVRQSLSDQWAAWFDGLDLVHDDDGNTLLKGTIADQAALHGVLTKIRDLNLVLLSVMRK